MAVKITTEKTKDQEEILEDLIRLGKRGGFFPASFPDETMPDVLKEQAENVMVALSDQLQERLHNPKNYMMAFASFALYIGMGGYYLWKWEPEEVTEKGVLELLLYKSDLLSIDVYVADLTELNADAAYAGRFRDFLSLFQTRALMLGCNGDPEKLNPETCKVAACAMYRLGILLQAERMSGSKE